MATLGASAKGAPRTARQSGSVSERLAAAALESAAIKHLPHNRMIRELIRQNAREAAAQLHEADPPSRAELEDLARAILARLKQPEGFVGWTMVELANGFWYRQVAALPYSRRIFLVPRSLVELEGASLAGDPRGVELPRTLADCLAVAQRLGYRTLASEDSGEILEAILSGDVDAIVGLGTLDDLEKALERILPAGIPAVALPLLSEAGQPPRLDGDWAAELLTAQREAVLAPTRSYVHLMRRAKQMFEPEQLSRLAPRLHPAAPWQPLELQGELDPLSGTETIAFDFLAKGGKHSRPFITLAVYDALTGGLGTTGEGPAHLAELSSAVLRTAMSIETFHKASLVHDDIEDDDAFRYGAETLHRRHGTPTAINVGDYLIGLGYRLVSREAQALGGDVVSDILDRLAAAHMQLAQGQGAELLWRDASDKRLTPNEAIQIYALKTSPAFEAALYAGVRLAQPVGSLGGVLHRFAYHLGVAFQIQNDLDDWDGDAKNKLAAAGDVVGGRPTLLWALALAGLDDRGRSELESLVAEHFANPATPARVRGLYQRAGVFDEARQTIDEHAAAAVALAQQVEPEPLRRLFYYLIDMVLERPGRLALAEAAQAG